MRQAVLSRLLPGSLPALPAGELSSERRRATVLSDEKKLSIAALSQTLPDRLMEQTTPWSAMSRWNCSLVYWLPRSE
jgi:hypothetical protein